MNKKPKHLHNFSFFIENENLTTEKKGQNSKNFDLFSEQKSILKNAAQKLIRNREQIKLLDICSNRKQIELSNKITDEIKQKYNKLYIFGMGGSSLGGQALCGSKFYQLLSKTNIEIIFIDNIHYHNFSIFLEKIDFRQTAFLTISKSGATIETIAQILVTRDFFAKQIAEFGADNFYFITEDNNTPLAHIAKDMKRPIILHDKDIGGRYSCFLPVSLIPAKLVDININNFVLGGQNIINEFLDRAENSCLIENTAIILGMIKKGYANHVFMPYMQRLYQLIYWYAQLFAESLGKDGKGMMPIKALGSVDQHSLLQLFLAGPKNNFFTFITQSSANLGNQIKLNIANEKIKYFQNNSLGDVINANQEATIATLREHNIPLRRIHFNNFDDKALGELMMYLMLETILLGYALDVNPFDQPEVELGKIKAKEILGRKNKLLI